MKSLYFYADFCRLRSDENRLTGSRPDPEETSGKNGRRSAGTCGGLTEARQRRTAEQRRRRAAGEEWTNDAGATD